MAKDVGTRRIPVTGIDRHGADFQDDMFAYQAKLRKVIPSWLFDWLGGIRGKAAESRRTGVLILKRPGMLDRDALVVVTWADWLELHGAPRAADMTPTPTGETVDA